MAATGGSGRREPMQGKKKMRKRMSDPTISEAVSFTQLWVSLRSCAAFSQQSNAR